MNAHILEKDITDLFGIDEMTKEDREAFLEDVGNLILESTVTRLMADMKDEEKKKLEAFVAEIHEDEDMLEKFEQEYPAVKEILQEEVAAFKKEAVDVLSAHGDG